MQTTFTLRKLAAAALPLLLSGQVMAAPPPNGAEAFVDVSARVIAPLQIQGTRELAFGTIVGGGYSGTLQVDYNSGVSSTGGVQTINQVPVTPTAAEFTVAGEPGYSYSVSLPADAIVLEPNGQTMTIDGFATDSTSRQIANNGGDVFHVGGVLNVPSNVAPGAYTGTFVVGVNYN